MNEEKRKTLTSLAAAFKSHFRRFGETKNFQAGRATLSPQFILAFVVVFCLSLVVFWQKFDEARVGKAYEFHYESKQEIPVSLGKGQVYRQEFKGAVNGLEFINLKLLAPGGGELQVKAEC